MVGASGGSQWTCPRQCDVLSHAAQSLRLHELLVGGHHQLAPLHGILPHPVGGHSHRGVRYDNERKLNDPHVTFESKKEKKAQSLKPVVQHSRNLVDVQGFKINNSNNKECLSERYIYSFQPTECNSPHTPIHPVWSIGSFIGSLVHSFVLVLTPPWCPRATCQQRPGASEEPRGV